MPLEYSKIQFRQPEADCDNLRSDAKQADILFGNGYLIALRQLTTTLGPHKSLSNVPSPGYSEGTFEVRVYAPDAEGVLQTDTDTLARVSDGSDLNDTFQKAADCVGYCTPVQILSMIAALESLPDHTHNRDDLTALNAELFPRIQCMGDVSSELMLRIRAVSEMAGDIKNEAYLRSLVAATLEFDAAVIEACRRDNLNSQQVTPLRQEFAKALTTAGVIDAAEYSKLPGMEGTLTATIHSLLYRAVTDYSEGQNLVYKGMMGSCRPEMAT